MSKSGRKAKRPNIAPAALLRSRLEAAWLAGSAAQQTPELLEAALQTASQGLRPEVVASTVLATFAAAAPEVQAKLEVVLPAWLARQNSLEVLASLAGRGQLNKALQAIALRWLAAAGREVAALVPSAAGTFHSAYLLEGEWQTAVIVLWYSNPQRSRARGMEFLIDGNPPWDWAVKDVMLFPNKRPEQLIERYVKMWEEQGEPMTPVDAGALKRRLVLALKQNAAANIRLPADLVQLREEFFEHVLSLPDGPDTPAFSADDFNRLSATGQSAEAVSEFEHTVARRIRLDDGQEVFVDPSLADMEFEDWDWEEEDVRQGPRAAQLLDPASLQRYRQYRTVQVGLNNKIIKGLARGDFDAAVHGLDVGAAGRQLRLESEDELSVVMDYAIYEVGSPGTRAIDRYRERPGGKDQVERELLDAAAASAVGVYRVEAVDQPTGQLTLQQLEPALRTVVVTDINFSQSPVQGAILFTRLLELPELTMTGGAALIFEKIWEADVLRVWSEAAPGWRYRRIFELHRQHGVPVAYARVETDRGRGENEDGEGE